MTKAAKLAAKLEHMDIDNGMTTIEASQKESINFDVIDDAMCIMHSDGSVNIVEHLGKGRMTVEIISSASIFKVLKHYRPFKEVFKGKVQYPHDGIDAHPTLKAEVPLRGTTALS